MRFQRVCVPAFFAICAGVLCGCGRADDDQMAGTHAPVVTVQVEEVKATPVPNLVELPGRIEAVRSAQLRARVDGIVERQLYREGADVAAGTPLFQIDPRDMKARLQQARAGLASAKATRTHSQSMKARLSSLVERKAVSVQEYETADSSLRQAEASVLEAQAAVDRAELALDFATVRAPISGRAGRAQVSEGALVSAGAATLLTQVDQLDPLFATFNPSSAGMSELFERIRSGSIVLDDMHKVKVTLVLETGERYLQEGIVDFTEDTVDPSTGSRTLRARFDNPDRRLLPGQFVRGIIAAGMVRDGVSVSERAIAIGADEASVMTVNAEGIVMRQVVSLAGQSGGRWIVQGGLKPGERVVVDGWHKVRPGQRVSAKMLDVKAATGTKAPTP